MQADIDSPLSLFVVRHAAQASFGPLPMLCLVLASPQQASQGVLLVAASTRRMLSALNQGGEDRFESTPRAGPN
jgi:hypothetical protein